MVVERSFDLQLSCLALQNSNSCMRWSLAGPIGEIPLSRPAASRRVHRVHTEKACHCLWGTTARALRERFSASTVLSCSPSPLHLFGFLMLDNSPRFSGGGVVVVRNFKGCLLHTRRFQYNGEWVDGEVDTFKQLEGRDMLSGRFYSMRRRVLWET